MRVAILTLLLLAPLCAAQPAAPQDWLVIGSVDKRGRRPFNPDRVFHRYLLDPKAAPPKEGESVGKQKWTRKKADEKGRVTGRISYAYATVASDQDIIVLARAPGGGRLYINGDAFVADIYGMGHSGVPVHLKKGTNHIFVRGVRGGFRLEFKPIEKNALSLERDKTVPHGEGKAGVVFVNATLQPRDGMAPLGLRKRAVDAEAWGLKPKPIEPGKAYRRTFISKIDGSVQQYAVLPAEQKKNVGLVLTLHGAGVDCLGQARSYSRKRNLWIVAPTNRRPFGFDWQDWGRKDAYEALEDAMKLSGADPDRIYLTGHSMGGHGTWHLAVNDPDRWAAIAPSAGWISFDTYGGRPKDKRQKLWHGADGASLTMELLQNLVGIPTFILHGEKDDEVPVREAQTMEALLIGVGATPAVHYQPGAGHWWNGKAAKGVDCVDWPGIFETFAASRRVPEPQKIDFTTADPGVDAEHYWIRIEQPIRYGERARIRAERVADGVRITTDNVRRFRCDYHGRIVVDGKGWETTDTTWFVRTSVGSWIPRSPTNDEKTPERSGPFKRAFDNNFVFVYGWAEDMARARFDAQMWWYRGNGDVEVVSAEEFLKNGYKGRNVILYGNSRNNPAWKSVLPRSCPVEAVDGWLKVGETVRFGDDWACCFVYPRKDDKHALVGVFAHTGPRAARLGYALLPFGSGVGYPDYAVFSSAFLTRGDEGVADAGWFDHNWKLPR